MRSAHPELDAANVINRIIRTARPSASATAVPDPLYGYGLVDAAAAVSATVPTVSENPMGSLEEWIRLYRRADAGPAPAPTVAPVAIEPLPRADAATQPVLAAAAVDGHPPLRDAAARGGHGLGYTGGARRHCCCPTHPIGPLVRLAEPLNF